MSDPNQLPTGRVPLSAVGDEKPSEILPKRKAIILYWMWNAYEASEDPANANDKDLIIRFAPVIASEFSTTEHKIMISTPSIVNYYHNAQKNAIDFRLEFGQPLDVWTVASIIKSQVNDQETYMEVSSFLEDYENKTDLTPQSRKVMAIVLDTVRRTSKMLRDCWNAADSSGMPFLDPELRQMHDFNPVPITLAKVILDEVSSYLFENL